MVKVNYIKRIDVDGKELVVRLTPSVFNGAGKGVIYTLTATSTQIHEGKLANFSFTLYNILFSAGELNAKFAVTRFKHWLRKLQEGT